MNPDTNRFEALTSDEDPNDVMATDTIDKLVTLLRPNGDPVPKHWCVFCVGEHVVIKDYTFRVAYIGETAILFEPVGVTVLGKVEP